MNSIADGSVIVQTSVDALPCPPPWWGELVLLSQHLKKQGILTRLAEGVRFERRRFGHYELIDFLVVLFGYAVSSEPTLERFYEAARPWAQPFMALFGRDRLPSRSALSRALAALTAPVSKPCVRCFSTICWPGRYVQKPRAQGCGIGKRSNGESSTSMARVKPQALVLYLTQTLCHLRSVASTPCVLQATPDGSGARWSVPVRRSCRPTAISGSAVSETVGTGSIVRNYARRSRSSGLTCRPISFPGSRPCCVWTEPMARERSS